MMSPGLLQKIPSRLLFLFCSLLSWTGMWARKGNDDQEMEMRSRSARDVSRSVRDVSRSMKDYPEGLEGLEGLDDTPTSLWDSMASNVTVELIFWLVVLVIACYVFGKIWKGCSYLLILYAAIMYFIYIND